MTLDDANTIVQIYGKYLEYASQKFTAVFLTSIPESVLPFPKDTLGVALQIMAQHYHKSGNDRAAKLMQEVGAHLYFAYKDDEEALIGAAKNLSDPKFRQVILASLKHHQKAWLETQDAPEYDPNEKWDGTI
jgi:hypothetical protein